MVNETQRLRSVLANEEMHLSVGGDWTVASAGVIDASIKEVFRSPSATRTVSIDAGGIEKLDTFGACLIKRLVESARGRGYQVRFAGTERFSGLIEHVIQSEELKAPTKQRSVQSLFQRTKHLAAATATDFAAFIAMLGAVGQAFGQILVNPRRFRITPTAHHIDRVAWQAIPIIFLITFLIGSIIAQQGFFHFSKFGADDYVVDLVGILVLREIGVLLVAIMVAGRSGSSYTAELGSMKMREEIDALRTMGKDPIEVLILPRVFALVCATPILALLGSLAALTGGGLVAWLYGGMSPSIFVERLREAVSVTHFEVGMIKAPFMALVIGIVACTEALRVGGSAESLGSQTTQSVVKSIFVVIVLDGLFAIFFASIDM